ncbi:hypothetical protein BMS3Abin05_00540 [bacterium BMS3Abin05]|nr:hypothetical protein BMS3Abin05_00540 [bacterium BMS3Abin05]GBE28620.1 hypothetical protein BMS3Bbin03_02568 [bacterium BMS3Bbin03]
MKARDDTVYLRHILDAIRQIEVYLRGVSRKAFDENPLLQDGIICQTN